MRPFRHAPAGRLPTFVAILTASAVSGSFATDAGAQPQKAGGTFGATSGGASAAASASGGSANASVSSSGGASTAATPSAPSPTVPGAAAPSGDGEAPPADAATSAAGTGVASPSGKPDTRGSAMRAYQTALAAQKLGVSASLSLEIIQNALADVEQKLADGRRDEAIGDLVYLVESPRFDPFASFDEGRTAIFLMGDALGRAGAYDPARGYLVPLLDKNPPDVWTRRAVRSLVDFGLASDRPETFLGDLSKLPTGMPEEVTSDVAYLAGRTDMRTDKSDAALAEFAKVTPHSRFWAQATYLSGLIHVNNKRFKDGEREFCKVADVKQTPRAALAFGGSELFEVRDMARLGLGRIAHEQYRFDDSRYYYYLVPNDSEHLPEALYESANSRYEAKDYRSARDLLDEMRSRGDRSRYEDEVWVFDAYVDLALCQFPAADEKLKEFIKRYEPVRDTARRVAADDHALGDLTESVRAGSDAGANAGNADATSMRSLAELLRRDVNYGAATLKLTELDREMSGLRQTMAALDDSGSRLTSSKEVRPRSAAELSGTPEERAERVRAEIADVRRLIRQAKESGGHAADVQQMEQQLADLQSRASDLEGAVPAKAVGSPTGTGLPDLVSQDRAHATDLYGAAQKTRTEVLAASQKAAKDALTRLDFRLSRLLRRARLGRIETVLGKKRALEVEIEALTEGYLPQGAVDSLEAARYLQDNEEYWPFDGEDWADEYVGGEGLR